MITPFQVFLYTLAFGAAFVITCAGLWVLLSIMSWWEERR